VRYGVFSFIFSLDTYLELIFEREERRRGGLKSGTID